MNNLLHEVTNESFNWKWINSILTWNTLHYNFNVILQIDDLEIMLSRFNKRIINLEIMLLWKFFKTLRSGMDKTKINYLEIMLSRFNKRIINLEIMLFWKFFKTLESGMDSKKKKKKKKKEHGQVRQVVYNLISFECRGRYEKS